MIGGERFKMKYDFHGWATKNDLRCSDGRTIRQDAFKECDGKTVPLVWQHRHDDPSNVLGHALLENRAEGVYVYGSFNNSAKAIDAKESVAHGDIVALSIYANNLQQRGSDVLHGVIREVSLVLAGANPGAFIESPRLAHSDEFAEDEATIYSGELFHAESGETADKKEPTKSDKEDKTVADEAKKQPEEEEKKGEETIQDVFDTLTEKQKKAVYYVIGQAMDDKAEKVPEKEEAKHSEIESEEDKKMKENIFDKETIKQGGVISHADQQDILEFAKQSNVGSFKRAMEIYAAEHNQDLQHDATAGGFVQPAAGVSGDVTQLFPEYKDVRPGAPELITNDQGWIGTVMRKVHKSPISRIRTRQVDIRNAQQLRAKGYQKGKQKQLAGNFELLSRETDPQTVYVRNQLHRDDIVDITDFDYVQYLYNIDRMMLNEELATAMMLGDGRTSGDADKISETHIRPIWTDDDLYTIHTDVDIAGAKQKLQGSDTSANFGDNYIYAEAIIEAMLYARENYKGTGTPDFYITPHLLNIMLLARDLNGRRIYDNKTELAAALNVNEIYTAEQFEGRTRTVAVVKDGVSTNHTKKLLGLLVNLSDYSLGATKGGEVTHYTDFDIDFNTQKSLLETRVSGALTRVYSAIALEEDITGA